MNATEAHRMLDIDTPPLWRELFSHATEMHFFRFCELLERSAPERPLLGATESPADDPIRFRSNARLGFPSREIDAVECEPGQTALPPTVRTTFLGLYGVDARMPSYFFDQIAQNHEGAEPLAAFLDLFHHRVVTQYYRIWRKYRYPVGFQRGGRDAVSTYLLSFAGLGLGAPDIETSVGTRKLLSMLALMGQKTRTAEGVAGVLRHAVPDATITVEEFHPVWVAVAATEPMPLGEHCVLGGGFFDRGNCVKIVIAPTTPSSVRGLMPGQPMYQDVVQMLRLYLGYEAQAVLHMHVQPALMPSPVLEPQSMSLGYTAMLPFEKARGGNREPVRVQLGMWNRPCES